MFPVEVTDDEILPGACHVRCLHDLGVARLWAEAVEDYYHLRWPQWRTGRSAGVRWRLHSSHPARRFHLWRADGRLSSFPYAALTATALTPTALTATVPAATALTAAALHSTARDSAALTATVPAIELTTEVAEVGTGYAAALLTAMGTAESGTPVPLAEVTAALGLADRYPAVEGVLARRLRARRPDAPDILIARYRLVLDAAVLRAARALIRDAM
jgi:hypothetical protein